MDATKFGGTRNTVYSGTVNVVRVKEACAAAVFFSPVTVCPKKPSPPKGMKIMKLSKALVGLVAASTIAISALAAPAAAALEVKVTGNTCTLSISESEARTVKEFSLKQEEDSLRANHPGLRDELNSFFSFAKNSANSLEQVNQRADALAADALATGQSYSLQYELISYISLARETPTAETTTLTRGEAQLALVFLEVYAEQPEGAILEELGYADALRACIQGKSGNFGKEASSSSGSSGSSGFSFGSS